MLPLRSELQQKRPPSPAFEAPPVIFPPDISVKKSKSYNSKVKTPVLAVIWLRSFCAVTHFAPKPQKKPPSKKKKLQKVRLRPKNEEGDGPRRDVPPKLKKKTKKRVFPPGRKHCASKLCYDLARNQFKSGVKRRR